MAYEDSPAEATDGAGANIVLAKEFRDSDALDKAAVEAQIASAYALVGTANAILALAQASRPDED